LRVGYLLAMQKKARRQTAMQRNVEPRPCPHERGGQGNPPWSRSLTSLMRST